MLNNHTFSGSSLIYNGVFIYIIFYFFFFFALIFQLLITTFLSYLNFKGDEQVVQLKEKGTK